MTFITVLANADAVDDLRARSAVRQIGYTNRFAKSSETLTHDARLRDGAHAAVVPAVIALVVAPVAVVLRLVALRRGESRRKSKSN